MPADFNHLILYAKGWYKRGNLLDDVKIILGERCAIDPNYLTQADVWGCCVHALEKYAPEDVFRFLNDLFTPRNPKTLDKWFDPNCPLEQAIQLILDILSRLKIMDVYSRKILIDLGTPDEKLLPLVDDKAKERYQKLVDQP